MVEIAGKAKINAEGSDPESSLTKIAKQASSAVGVVFPIDVAIVEGLTARLGQLQMPGTKNTFKETVSSVTSTIISLLKDAPGGLMAILPDRKTGIELDSTRDKVRGASHELAVGELTLVEKKQYNEERQRSMTQTGPYTPGPMETRVYERSKEIVTAEYARIDKQLPPQDRKNCAAEEAALKKWDKDTQLSTIGGRIASMPETPSLLFREQSVLARLENHRPGK